MGTIVPGVFVEPNEIVTNNRITIKLFEDLDAWNPNIRSKAAIRTSDTRHFVDPSIGTASLGLGPKDLINDGADALNTLADTIDTTKMKKPSFKMVLTAVGPYAYQRPDGIFVVPIGCLKD